MKKHLYVTDLLAGMICLIAAGCTTPTERALRPGWGHFNGTIDMQRVSFQSGMKQYTHYAPIGHTASGVLTFRDSSGGKHRITVDAVQPFSKKGYRDGAVRVYNTDQTGKLGLSGVVLKNFSYPRNRNTYRGPVEVLDEQYYMDHADQSTSQNDIPATAADATWDAVKRGEIQRAESLLKEYPKLMGRRFHANGDTLLHCAAFWGQKGMAELLIGVGANVNVKNYRDATPLHTAAVMKKTDIARLFLQQGSDVNAVDENGDTALHQAAFRSTQLVELLLANGAKTAIRNRKGETPYEIATRWDKKEVMSLMKKYQQAAGSRGK